MSYCRDGDRITKYLDTKDDLVYVVVNNAMKTVLKNEYYKAKAEVIDRKYRRQLSLAEHSPDKRKAVGANPTRRIMRKNKFSYGDKVMVTYKGYGRSRCRNAGRIGEVSDIGYEREQWYYNIEFGDDYVTYSEWQLELHNGITREYIRDYQSKT